MKIRCPYCNTMFDDTLTQCPQCGAPSEGVKRTESNQPITIAQLAQWYKDRGLPPYETTRFFIGIDCREARAFGIYQDPNTGNFVVYKNLSSGERKVRYEGTDEAYAVNELYMRLKQEILQQKSAQVKRNAAAAQHGGSYSSFQAGGRPGRRRFFTPRKSTLIIAAIIIVAFVCLFIADANTPDVGYYNYNGVTYYHAAFDSSTDDWYYYDTDYDTWEHTWSDLPEELENSETSGDFFYTSTWDSSTQVSDFEDSSYADDYDYSSDDDSDYDWGSSSSWDSGSSDWDSDW